MLSYSYREMIIMGTTSYLDARLAVPVNRSMFAALNVSMVSSPRHCILTE